MQLMSGINSKILTFYRLIQSVSTPPEGWPDIQGYDLSIEERMRKKGIANSYTPGANTPNESRLPEIAFDRSVITTDYTTELLEGAT